jgi:ADP-ribose diphosphatase
MPEREIYAGRVVTLRLQEVELADGQRRVREVVEHRPGAAVVAVDDEQQVLLVRQHRPAVGAHVLELPAGIVDPDEEPIACARRELEEETGYTPESLELLARFYTSPGFCTEVLYVYAAHGLRACRAQRDEEEELELVRLPLSEALQRVLETELSDAKTITGLLAYQARQRAPRVRN